MRRILLACFAVLFFGVGCDAVGQPTWAARIDGEEISIADVEGLMTVIESASIDPAAPTTSTTEPVQLTGSSMRDALSFLIRWDLIERRLAQLDAEVTDEARGQAEQQVGELKASKATRTRIIDGLAAELTLGTALTEQADDPAIAALIDEFYEENEGTWTDWICLEGLAVPAADRAAVDAALAAPGATIEAVAASGLPNVQPLFATGVNGCFPSAQIPPELQALLDATPDGQIAVQEQQDQTVGTVALVLRELDRRDIGREDPEVLTAFAGALQAQDGQQWLDRAIGSAADGVDIEILSTIGSGYDKENLAVTPPPAPLGATTTTLDPLAG